ncbi:serine protease [Ramlibacter tataouinensis]|uniref:S1C family serine protease n=1 Tax=Ramlibacter tataouinensis TaxID=94132 RepID=UPI0022F3BA68|nr:serine protease [Ramlibacter tataouinensis]WBY00164.1 serine protease [Ramlibacter tataouinensis]
MQLRASFAAGVLSLLAAAPTSAQDTGALAPEQLFERLAPSVWTVETLDANGRPLATGSAVVIAPGSLVTNCHVLTRASRVLVGRENVSYGATLDQPDPERDLCLLKVRNFTAPAVPIGSVDEVRVGSRVYAIGSPRGLEQTISDGLLSGVRRSASGDFTALQITVPISNGSSGGGLFDARGRLIGITTFMLRDAQNLNFALPASWIAEVPQRAQRALAAHAEGRQAARAPGRGQVFEYQLRDRLTGAVRTVVYRLDRVDSDRLVFNQGTRVERPGGAVVTLTQAIGGEYEVAMPPGGWITAEPQRGSAWSIRYSSGVPGQFVGMELDARTLGETTMRLKERELRVVQVAFTGYTSRTLGPATNPQGRYTATAWYAPELGRIVRFEARTRGGSGGVAFYIDEQLQLVDIRDD